MRINTLSFSMEKKPYHHLPDGTFRNVEGSPKRDPNIKWSYKIFNAERKKIKIDIPKNHIVPREQVLKNLEKHKNDDYIAWIGHATFLIKLGNTTIITDPLFSKNTGPLFFGPNINGPVFLENKGSVIIVVSPSLIKKVAWPIQAI